MPSPAKPSVKAFTLLELIVVLIIIGVLGVLGFAKYTQQLERSRVSEAEIHINAMRKLAVEYYLKNGSFDTMQNEDVGVGEECSPTSYYKYFISPLYSDAIYLVAERCTSGGKTPDATRKYYYYFNHYMSGGAKWHCYYDDDGSPCFGRPP